MRKAIPSRLSPLRTFRLKFGAGLLISGCFVRRQDKTASTSFSLALYFFVAKKKGK